MNLSDRISVFAQQYDRVLMAITTKIVIFIFSAVRSRLDCKLMRFKIIRLYIGDNSNIVVVDKSDILLIRILHLFNGLCVSTLIQSQKNSDVISTFV
jgi:hypothetical protein